MDNRFKLLKIFGILFKVFAFGAVIIGAVGAVGVLMSKGSPETPRGISIVMLLVSGLYYFRHMEKTFADVV